MGAHLNPLEKEVLIKRFQSNPNANVNDFCEANNISVTAFKKWVQKYSEEGIEGLITRNKGEAVKEVLPEGTEASTENYKREIMKLRIENERLKKSYTVETMPDGELVFKPLSRKNTKS